MKKEGRNRPIASKHTCRREERYVTDDIDSAAKSLQAPVGELRGGQN
ncbi:hypothetical protein ACFLVX_03215 [Chloroflexota bacterium]